jgi:hypothetical protein
VFDKIAVILVNKIACSATTSREIPDLLNTCFAGIGILTTINDKEWQPLVHTKTNLGEQSVLLPMQWHL